MGSTPVVCAPRSVLVPPNSCINRGVRTRGEAEFLDARHWAELAKRRARYRFPAWVSPADVLALERWAERLNCPDYPDVMSTPWADMLALNPGWPLAAFVGLMLEYARDP